MSPSGRSVVLGLMIVMAVTACRDQAPANDTTSTGQDLEPVEVVSELLAAVVEGRFEDTPPLTDGVQAALVTLAEGADATDVVELLVDGGEGVAANFWSGFAQTLDPSLDTAQITVEAGDATTMGGEEFVFVTATLPDGEPRSFVLRRDGSWKVDLLATFAPVLAERLIPAVESLLSSANTDGATVLARLNESEASLRVAVANPGIDDVSHQSLLALIERVTRATSS